MNRVNTVRKGEVLADGLISGHCRYPDRQSEPGDTFRGSTAQTGHKYQDRRNMLHNSLHAHGEKISNADIVLSVIFSQNFPDLITGATGLGCRCDLDEHFHRLHRIHPHGRFAGEHDAVCAVEDGIGHIRRLRPGRTPVTGHGLQHLSGGNDRFAFNIRHVYQLFLSHGNPFDGYFHAQITPGDHDTVGGFKNSIQPSVWYRSFDLGNNKRMVAQTCPGVTDSVNICCRLDKRLAYRVDTLFRSEFETFVVALRKGADAKVDVRQVKPFVR